MALWRKHRFISLQEQDGKDKIAAGSQFVVKRVGSTCVNNLDTTAGTGNSEETLIEFYKDLLELFHYEHGCKLRLVVDLSGAVLYSKDGDLLQRFELSNIRDVIYSTKKEEYSLYFILVAQEESELIVKAHVLLCEDKHKAKLLYDTFIEVFTLGSEMRKYRTQVSDSSALKGTVKQKPRINSEAKNSTTDSTMPINGRVNAQEAHAKLPRRQTWTHSSMTRPRIEEIDYQSNDSFTELARSRSQTGSTSSMKSHGSASDMNGNKILWLDSDVFM